MDSKPFASKGLGEKLVSSGWLRLMKRFRKHDAEAGTEPCSLMSVGLKASSSPTSPVSVILSKLFTFLSHWSSAKIGQFCLSSGIVVKVDHIGMIASNTELYIRYTLVSFLSFLKYFLTWSGLLQKLIPRERFACKWFIWEVISGKREVR